MEISESRDETSRYARSRHVRRQIRERGTFAPAWRDLYRRRLLVRCLIPFGLFAPLLIEKGVPVETIVLVIGPLAAYLWACIIVSRPWTGLFGFALGFGMWALQSEYGKPHYGELVGNVVFALIVVAAGDWYYASFRCPNCKHPFFAPLFGKQKYYWGCAHCDIHKGALYPPPVFEESDL